LKGHTPIDVGEVLPTDRVVHAGTQAYALGKLSR